MSAITQAADNQKLPSGEPAATPRHLADNIETQVDFKPCNPHETVISSKKLLLNKIRNQKEEKTVGEPFSATTNSDLEKGPVLPAPTNLGISITESQSKTGGVCVPLTLEKYQALVGAILLAICITLMVAIFYPAVHRLVWGVRASTTVSTKSSTILASCRGARGWNCWNPILHPCCDKSGPRNSYWEFGERVPPLSLPRIPAQ